MIRIRLWPTLWRRCSSASGPVAGKDSSIVVVERDVDAVIRRVGDTALSLSTSADSAALAIYMAQTYPQIPTEYVFCETDAELPETYDYLDRLEALLGKPLHRVNVLDYMTVTRKPTVRRSTSC